MRWITSIVRTPPNERPLRAAEVGMPGSDQFLKASASAIDAPRRGTTTPRVATAVRHGNWEACRTDATRFALLTARLRNVSEQLSSRCLELVLRRTQGRKQCLILS